ncbi:hypothetical protein STEG23_030881, partial [Scotinomys teguina]
EGVDEYPLGLKTGISMDLEDTQTGSCFASMLYESFTTACSEKNCQDHRVTRKHQQRCGHPYVTACKCIYEDNLEKLIIFFQYMGPGDGTQLLLPICDLVCSHSVVLSNLTS